MHLQVEFSHYEKNKLQERFSELERHNGSKTALLQHNCRTFWLEEILHATILLWSGNLRHAATLLLRTDRLYRVFPLCRYAGSGIRLGNEQINYRQRELGKLFNVSIIQNIASCPSLKNIHQWRASFKKQYVVMVERELEIKLY